MKQIYVHGLGQTPDSWAKTISNIKTDVHSVCLNLPELIQGKQATYQNLYAAFSDACNTYGEPVDLCGLSLGGVLALNYAIEHPERVNSLVLIATPYKMPKHLLQFQNVLFQCMPKSMFQQMGFCKRDFLQLCKTMMLLDFSNSLSKVSCPVLVLCGEKDTANKKASVKLADNLANAEFAMLKGIGHEVNTEAPEQLAAVLCRF
ncbi:MAG: alpha/beta hydrolase, partial [Lachnospiraceae bacterium]|nr:alpha/beta hydrolase [Lachnospiraceae bacterium]